MKKNKEKRGTQKKYIWLIIVILAVVGSIYYLEGMKASPGSSINTEDNLNLDINEFSEEEELVNNDVEKPALKDGQYILSPELEGISGYLNTNGEEIKISDFEGKVVLIDFWTYTCINCIRTLPFLTEWDEKYKDEGLVIIGVHTPEFEFEKIAENVQSAIDKNNINYAVVQDNDYATWKAFSNRYWPRKYLIDSEGYIRYDHIGEGGYEETELKIQELLAEIGENVEDKGVVTVEDQERFPTTPELFAGALFALNRNQFVGNKKTGETIEDYDLPDSIQENIIYLDGKWEHRIDNLHLLEGEGIVAIDYHAREVNIVGLAENLGPIEMEVFIDGEYVSEEQAGTDVQFSEDGKSIIIINEPRLYNVIYGEYGNYRLDLKMAEGFTFNAFTFG